MLIFELNDEDIFKKDDNEMEKARKIIHVNKKKVKIISGIVEPNSETVTLKNVYKEIAKISDSTNKTS